MQRSLYAGALAALYGTAIYPLRYEVRGITMEEKPQVKTLTFLIQAGETASSLITIRGLEAERDALVERGRIPWPRNGDACQMYGPMYKCQYEPICWDGEAMPEGIPEVKPFSHSGAKDFFRCPELYRLDRLNSERFDLEDDSAAKGRVFHLCMESIYNQLKKG